MLLVPLSSDGGDDLPWGILCNTHGNVKYFILRISGHCICSNVTS